MTSGVEPPVIQRLQGKVLVNMLVSSSYTEENAVIFSYTQALLPSSASFEEVKSSLISTYTEYMNTLELQCLRATRALLLGTPSPEDISRIEEVEQECDRLRSELSQKLLEAENELSQ